MRSLLDLNADNLIILLQHKVQFCCASALPIVKIISFGHKLLRHVVFCNGAHKGVPFPGKHRLLGNTRFHGQQTYITHIELKGRKISIDGDRLISLIDSLAL